MKQDENTRGQSFFEHLDELRVVFMRCLIAFMGGFLFCYFVTNRFVIDFLRAPLFRVLPPDQQKLYFTSLFENFLTHLKIAGYTSLFLFSPLYFYFIWRFISPGLYPRERKLVLPFLFATVSFFVGGAAFAYYVLFPVGFKYFVSYGLPGDTPLLTIDSYYGTALKLMALFGLAFELPVFISLMGFLGLVTAPWLRAQRRNAFLAITLVSAVVAPPDAISMLVLMGPLVLMYEGSIHVVAFFDRNRKASSSESPIEPGVEAESPFSGRSR